MCLNIVPLIRRLIELSETRLIYDDDRTGPGPEISASTRRLSTFVTNGREVPMRMALHCFLF